MKRLMLVLVALCGYAFGQGYDPAYTITAYKLSATEEACFSNTDSKASCFWKAWDDNSSLQEGELTCDPKYRGYWGQDCSNNGDLNVQIRFAWGDNGVYLLYKVTDDAWVGFVNPQDYENDATEFYIDSHDAQTLYNSVSGTSLFCNGNQQLTKDYCQIQIRFGGNVFDDQVTTFSRNYYDPNATWPACAPYYERGLTFAAAEQIYGIKIEILPSADSRVRIQEWFIPWNSIVGTPGAVPPRNQGDKLAITFGYNDLDVAGEQTTPVRWRNKGDPFGAVIPTGQPNEGQALNSWGDLLFGAALDGTIGGAPAECNSRCTDDECILNPNAYCFLPRCSVPQDSITKYGSDVAARAACTAIKIPLLKHVAGGKVVKQQFYSLSGKKLVVVNNIIQAPAGNMVIEKCTLSNGRTVNRLINAAAGMIRN